MKLLLIWWKKYFDDAPIIWNFIDKYIIEHKDEEWNGNVLKDEVAEKIDVILAEIINKISLN